MNYFFDTEFMEGFRKPYFNRWGRASHYIDLISIGIVAEDGREYYAISKEFNPRYANQWVRENVLSKLPERHIRQDAEDVWEDGMAGLPLISNPIYKSNKLIAQEIAEFVNYNPVEQVKDGEYTLNILRHGPLAPMPKPAFYAYYADYDWVVLCSLFGTMMDLPEGFPMYCRGLKQVIDDKAKTWDVFRDVMNADERLDLIKKHKDYPVQENEHNALDDAHWNKKLHDFLLTL